MSLWQILGGIGSVGAGIELADDIRGVGESAAEDMGSLATQLQDDTAFTGYGVTTGLGTSTVGTDGTTNLGVSRENSMYHGGLFNQSQGNSQMNNAAGYMQGFMGDIPGGNPAYQNAAGRLNTFMDNVPTSNPAYQNAAGRMNTFMDNIPSSNPAYQNAAGMYNQAGAGLSNAQQGALNASQQAMANSMADRAGREQDIYNSAMAMQQPGLDAQRASHLAREASTGRSGLMGSQFGGTGEDAAVARAQAQAQNQAAFQAMNQAESEMMNQANMASMFGGLGQNYAGTQGNLAAGLGGLGATQAQLGQAGAQIGGSMASQLAQMGATNAQLGQSGAQIGGNMATQLGQLGATNAQLGQSRAQIGGNMAAQLGQLGSTQANFGLNQYQQSYTPMQMQMQMLGLGGQNADRAQTGQLTGANLASQLGLGAIQAQVNAETTAADLYAKLFGSGMDAISGMDFGDPGGWF